MSLNKLLALGLLLALPGMISAAPVDQGQPFTPYTVTDAFGNTNTLSKETRYVIIASEKGVSGRVNDWLKTKDKDFLAAHHTEYVSDITPMPALITSMFALPKMRKYPFRILLVRDENFAKTYPHQDGKIALFRLDDHQIVTDIQFVDTAGDVEKAIAVHTP